MLWTWKKETFTSSILLIFQQNEAELLPHKLFQKEFPKDHKCNKVVLLEKRRRVLQLFEYNRESIVNEKKSHHYLVRNFQEN